VDYAAISKEKIMGRPQRLRPEFEHSRLLVNEDGVEIARLTLNDILVVNLAEVFYEIERKSAGGRSCKLSHLYITFGRTGTWARDPSIDGAVNELEHLKVIEQYEGRVRPIMTATRALKVIPQYVTSEELLAGLEPWHGE
jgi:hypothetical protein